MHFGTVSAELALTISVVSHGQLTLVQLLLNDLAAQQCQDFEVILTINVPEDPIDDKRYPFALRILRNESPRGFGANHNVAFEHRRGRYFAVVNPDVRLATPDFGLLLQPFTAHRVAAVAPVVRSVEGRIEDSARRFPTLGRLARRVLLGRREPDYLWNEAPIDVDWVAGMFVVFRDKAFQGIGGFDDRRFFMYFEDADICRRLWRDGWRVQLQPQVEVVHNAQRASHRSFKHLRWHLVSAMRYLTGL